MGHKKLIRFEELNTFSNVFQHTKEMQGKWNEYFKNNQSITLELACGKGEYSVGQGRLYNDRNFIGIDIKGNRIWRGAKTALDEKLDNVAFLRAEIDKLPEYFAKDEVDEIWITFPDPQLRLSKAGKRLTHPKFLRLYQQILKKRGLVHLKTDSPDLYCFTKTVIGLYNIELLVDYDNLYQQKNLAPELYIKTHYEGLDIAQSNRIHYLQFRVDTDLPKEKDAELKRIINEQAAI
ncbi:MAG: tRNA (guanosine(46)-N7)-methyltransferase TrmB [Chitinophagaceae bacterium]